MIYLRKEDGLYVGPFRSCKDAERFIQLMQLCGEIWAGTEIVDDEYDNDPVVRRTDYIQ